MLCRCGPWRGEQTMMFNNPTPTRNAVPMAIQHKQNVDGSSVDAFPQETIAMNHTSNPQATPHGTTDQPNPRRSCFALVGVIATLLIVSSCSSSGPADSADEQGEVASTEQPMSAVGMEKFIPLRIVNVLACNPALSTCKWKDRYDGTLKSIEVANQIYASAGIQFWVKSFEAYNMPDFADLGSSWKPTETKKQWQAVRSQLQKVIPVADTEWKDGDERTPLAWLYSVDTAIAAKNNPEELIIWVVNQVFAGNEDSYARYPENGRQIVIHQAAIKGGGSVLSHEIGHSVGLRHPFDHDTGKDPETMQTRTLADRWDLVFKPGAITIPGSTGKPHVFFNSRSEAVTAAQTSQLSKINWVVNINTGKHTCELNSSKIMECVVWNETCDTTCRKETYTAVNPKIKGLGFKFGSSEYGTNLMDYAGYPGDRRYLSDSQIELVRKYLRWTVSFSVNMYPTGNPVTTPVLPFTANLPLLGSASPRQVAEFMDFDRDGRRDIAVWLPPDASTPDGTFYIYLSSKNFSTANGKYMIVPLGKRGDIPLVADLSGDGISDVVVFQGGGGLNRDDPADSAGYWRWCPTNASNPVATTCSSPTVVQFGSRGDIPLAGLNFGPNTLRHLTIYRPQFGLWSWRSTTSSTAMTKYLGGPNSVLLPGLYDLDDFTDPAVYEPKTGDFRLLRSEQAWNTVITRSFGSGYVPTNTLFGDFVARSGAIPLSGMVRNAGGSLRRRAFSLYFPANGSWNTMWDPTAASPTIQSCALGNGAYDIPVPGLDANSDGYSDMFVLRPQPNPSLPFAYLRVSAPQSSNPCSGTEYPWTTGSKNWGKIRLFVVSDLFGDGKPDLLDWDPETMEVNLNGSDMNFQGGPGLYVANRRGFLL